MQIDSTWFAYTSALLCWLIDITTAACWRAAAWYGEGILSFTYPTTQLSSLRSIYYAIRACVCLVLDSPIDRIVLLQVGIEGIEGNAVERQLWLLAPHFSVQCWRCKKKKEKLFWMKLIAIIRIWKSFWKGLEGWGVGGWSHVECRARAAYITLYCTTPHYTVPFSCAIVWYDVIEGM